jgi:hypothetical protein
MAATFWTIVVYVWLIATGAVVGFVFFWWLMTPHPRRRPA